MGEKATEVEIKAEEVAEASGELVVINALTNINQLTEKQALGLLRGRYKGIVVDYTTAEGDKTARRLRGELVSIRTSGNKKRLELNRKRLEENKKCNEAFGRIETVVKELEDPYDKGIEAEEEKAKAIRAEKERQKAEAQKAVDDRIFTLANFTSLCKGTSVDIQEKLAVLENGELTEDLYPGAANMERAQAARDASVESIKVHLANTIASEEKAAQAAEQLKRDQAALAEQKRIQDEEDRRLHRERQAFILAQKEAQAKIDAENARIAADLKRQQDEMQARIDDENTKLEAEKQRLADEEAARQAEAEAAAIANEDVKVIDLSNCGGICKTDCTHYSIGIDCAGKTYQSKTSQVSEQTRVTNTKWHAGDEQPEMITIPVEHYNELKRDSELLHALMRGGVKTWANYEDALSLLEEV